MLAEDKTEIGSYFVATYPPFSVWSQAAVAKDAMPALAAPAVAGVPLGLYLHIPFCRKRCHFCYFRVYTDKNAREVEDYLDVVAREWELYGQQPAIAGRPLNFVYFGGGTPSFLSTQQLEGLVSRLHRARALGGGRGGHLRMRARHADRSEARRHPPHRRDAPEPRRRELRRPHPRAQRPRAPLARDVSRL